MERTEKLEKMFHLVQIQPTLLFTETSAWYWRRLFWKDDGVPELVVRNALTFPAWPLNCFWLFYKTQEVCSISCFCIPLFPGIRFVFYFSSKMQQTLGSSWKKNSFSFTQFEVTAILRLFTETSVWCKELDRFVSFLWVPVEKKNSFSFTQFEVVHCCTLFLWNRVQSGDPI